MRPASELAVGGLVPFTTVDFPGRLAAVVFCQGCAWRCVYCHNPHLQNFEPGRIAWDEVRAFLVERLGFLDGVVFSGGEPTAQPALEAALLECRAIGCHTGLHTAGIHPRRLRGLLPLLDWVGLDIKAPLDARYDLVTGRPGSAGPVSASLEILLEAGTPLQIRTTVDPALLGPAELDAISRELDKRHAPATVLQPMNPAGAFGSRRLPG